jgi:hypothetical protein
MNRIAGGKINIIHNTLSKERNGELVRLVLIQFNISALEERLVSLCTAKEGQAVVQLVQGEHLPVLTVFENQK